ncbi:MAG: cupin domain-containing protein, partial [bacterium]
MKLTNNVFEALIHPLSNTDFFTDYFEKKYHHASLQSPLTEFDLEKFEKLLWSHEKELADRIRLNKAGEEAHYIRDREGMDRYGWIMQHVREGYTVIFNGIESIDPGAAGIVLALNDVFHGPTSVNAFLTPPGVQGFLPHFDTHDVFVYQVEGSKKWNLYKGELSLPMDEQIYLVDQETLGEPLASYELEPGDVLYVPRGVIHGANTTNAHSLHLTIGIRPLLKVDYLKLVLDVLSREDPDFRKS